MSVVASKSIRDIAASEKLKKDRHTANMELVTTLATLVIESNGNLRFSQILFNFGFIEQNKTKLYIKYETDKGYLSDYDDGNRYYESESWSDEYHLEPKELLKRVKAECIKVLS